MKRTTMLALTLIASTTMTSCASLGEALQQAAVAAERMRVARHNAQPPVITVDARPAARPVARRGRARGVDARRLAANASRAASDARRAYRAGRLAGKAARAASRGRLGRFARAGAKRFMKRAVPLDVAGIDPVHATGRLVRDPAGTLRHATDPRNVDRYLRQRGKYVEQKYLRGGHVADAARSVDRLTGGRAGRAVRGFDRATGGHAGRAARTASKHYNRAVTHTARGVNKGYRAAKKGLKDVGKAFGRAFGKRR